MSDLRQPEHDIDSLFVQRWSPRGFKPVTIERSTLLQLFEAARWAPSAYNAQPWRFIYSLRDSAQWPSFVELLSEYNRAWAEHASALVLIISRKTFFQADKQQHVDVKTHSFDAGAAWAHFALQAYLKGWATHAIGGYDQKLARERLNIPDDYHLEAIIAVGQLGSAGHLSEALQAREKPTPRRPLAGFVAEGQFGFED